MNKNQIIEIATKAAVKAALEWQEQQQHKQAKSRHDKRLRNTGLLLENYQMLKDHCDYAVYDKNEVLADEIGGNVIDILDELEGVERTDYIKSIKESVSRTKVILTHIDEMIKIYRIYCETSDRPEDMRRYRILMKKLEGVKPAVICEEEGIDQSTYYRDNAEIKRKLSTLFFGIDGLSGMRKKSSRNNSCEK